MSMVLKRTALLGALLVCSALGPVSADEPKTQLLASMSGVTNYSSDPSLDRAVKLILESQVAREHKMRRDNLKPASQERVVRTDKDLDGVMILGGSAAVPM